MRELGSEVNRSADGAFVTLTTAILAAGVLLTTATQLRPETLPIGIGEILLAGWIAWQLVVLAVSPRNRAWRDATAGIGVFWGILFLIMLLGLASSYFNGRWDEEGAAHDAIALLLSAIYSLVLAVALTRDAWMDRLLTFLVTFSAVAMGLLLVLAARRGTFLGIDPWYATIRFTGWAKNPNQIGLLLASMPFLALWLRPRQNRLGRSAMLASIAVIGVAGVLCLSDALYLSWIVGLLVVATIAWIRFFSRTSDSRLRAYLGIVGIPGTLLAAFIGFSRPITEGVVARLIDMYELGSQGSVRLQIWAHGFEAFAESPFIGHGPGAFAGVRDSFDAFEAHNTFIDLATKSGIIGLTIYVLALAALHLQLLRKQQYLLLGALISVTTFSVFHYVLRQPVYWTVILVCVRAAWGTEIATLVRRARPGGSSRENLPPSMNQRLT